MNVGVIRGVGLLVGVWVIPGLEVGLFTGFRLMVGVGVCVPVAGVAV